MSLFQKYQTQFLADPERNPETGRAINIDGPTYRKLVTKYGQPDVTPSTVMSAPSPYQATGFPSTLGSLPSSSISPRVSLARSLAISVQSTSSPLAPISPPILSTLSLQPTVTPVTTFPSISSTALLPATYYGFELEKAVRAGDKEMVEFLYRVYDIRNFFRSDDNVIVFDAIRRGYPSIAKFMLTHRDFLGDGTGQIPSFQETGYVPSLSKRKHLLFQLANIRSPLNVRVMGKVIYMVGKVAGSKSFELSPQDVYERIFTAHHTGGESSGFEYMFGRVAGPLSTGLTRKNLRKLRSVARSIVEPEMEPERKEAVELAKLLVAYRPDRIDDFNSALLKAVASGFTEFAQLMLDAGATNKNEALKRAIGSRRSEVAALLRSRGAV